MARRPNFLVVITDQQRADHLGCYGAHVLRTPHIDRIAAHGVVFDRFYVASPVCMPNRATLMTGRMPSLHGVRHNGIPLSLDAVTFADLLRAAGYQTALAGKSHLQNMIDGPALLVGETATEARRLALGRYDQEIATKWRDDPGHDLDLPYYGFDHVDLVVEHGDAAEGHYSRWLKARHPDPASLRGPANALASGAVTLPQAWRTSLPEGLYPTTYVAQKTIERLEAFAADRTQPFFLMCSFPDPHHPFTPPGRYWDLYDPTGVELPRSWRVRPECMPPHVRQLHAERDNGTRIATKTLPFAATERETREALAFTYGMITMIDDAIGRIVDRLDALDLADDTIVIFTSDHGDFMGDHQLLLKGPIHYQSLIRTPLIWSDPLLPATGRRGQLASHIDFARTVLARAGVAPANGMQGRALLPIIADRGATGAREVLIEEEGQRTCLGFTAPVRMRSLVTEAARVSVYSGVPWGELYDLGRDPDEMVNLWDDPGAAALKADMLERLARAMIAATDKSPAPLGLA